jgi:hypothetical protein
MRALSHLLLEQNSFTNWNLHSQSRNFPLLQLDIKIDIRRCCTGICKLLTDPSPNLTTTSLKAHKHTSKRRHLPALQRSRHRAILFASSFKLRPDQSRISPHLHLAETQVRSAGKWPSSVLLEEHLTLTNPCHSPTVAFLSANLSSYPNL